MLYKTIFTIFLIFFNISQPAHSTTHSEKPLFSAESVTLGEKNVVLLGSTVTVGQPAPDFKVVNERFKITGLNDFSGKTLLLNIVPSIDTGVGSLQAKQFNQQLDQLPNNVIIITISTDTPFAQKRFADSENISQPTLLSDAVWHDFGHKYGLLIKDMGLLARALFVIDAQGILTYKQVVGELSQEPDYEAALAALKALVREVEPTVEDVVVES
ncbi:MAG: thiol peroxidase [Alteromonadaceae bacterium]|jgi:thiol peroxidase